MNERIKQLALKAGGGLSCIAEPLEHPWKFSERELEKFAELIVRECIEQVKGQYVPVIEDKEMMKDTHWDGYVQCGVDSVVAIREHFYGVEE
jgi:hypothetical protein